MVQEPGADDAEVGDAAEVADAAVEVGEVADVRRAPRYGVFVLTGALVAVVLAVVAVLTLGRGDLTALAVVVTALSAAVLGAALGGLVAVVQDRPRSR